MSQKATVIVSENPTKAAARAARDKRLKEALRANLRRRKGQARERAEESDETTSHAPLPHPEGDQKKA